MFNGHSVYLSVLVCCAKKHLATLLRTFDPCVQARSKRGELHNTKLSKEVGRRRDGEKKEEKKNHSSEEREEKKLSPHNRERFL
jgi:hypothetical protein